VKAQSTGCITNHGNSVRQRQSEAELSDSRELAKSTLRPIELLCTLGERGVKSQRSNVRALPVHVTFVTELG
jgi:hypothetical protein